MNLKPRDRELLRTLDDVNAATVSQLADDLGLHEQTIYSILRFLSTHNFVQRSNAKWQLTEKGEERV